jgi:hypothetical protein
MALRKFLLLSATMAKIVTSRSSRRFCKCIYSPSFVSKCRVFTKGILLRPYQKKLSLTYAHFLVFGYTEYKGKQKEIFEAAISGVLIRNLST